MKFRWTRWVGAGLAAALAIGVMPAVADDPTTAAEARTQVKQLSREYDELAEEAAQLREKLDAAQKESAELGKDIKTAQKSVARAKSDIASVALAQYRQQSQPLSLLTADNPETFLQQMGALDQLGRTYADHLRRLQDEEADLESMRDDYALQKAEIEADSAKADKLAAQAQAKVDAMEDTVERLDAAEKAKYEQEQERLRQESAAAATTTTATTTQAATRTTQTASRSKAAPAAAPVATGGSGRQAAALGFALAQVGKPYVLFARGPYAYDCSSLMQASYAAAGVAIPPSVFSQWRGGRSVPVSQMVPGDIVIMNGGGHVAMYAGGGKIVHATNPAMGVLVTDISWAGFITDVRRY